MKQSHVDDFLLQALETELGALQVYEAALRCASDAHLRDQWVKHRAESEQHARVYRELIDGLRLDASLVTPARALVRRVNESLVAAITSAHDTVDADTAQIVAAESVAAIEAKGNLNWELVGDLGKKTRTDYAHALRKAYEHVVEQKNEHLYHARGWMRDLWIRRLGLSSVAPAPSEARDVRSSSSESQRGLRGEVL